MPVRFDDAAADAVVTQLEGTAASLLELAAQFEHQLPSTTEDWRGGFRRTFDAISQRHDVVARQLAAELHLMAVAVRAGQLEADAARLAEQAGPDGDVDPGGIFIIPRTGLGG